MSQTDSQTGCRTTAHPNEIKKKTTKPPCNNNPLIRMKASDTQALNMEINDQTLNPKTFLTFTSFRNIVASRMCDGTFVLLS